MKNAKIMALLTIILLFVFLVWHLAPRRWDGQSRFTVVDFGPPPRVVSFDPATRKGVELLLPDDLEVETLLGRGRYPLKSLPAAGRPFPWWASGSVVFHLGIFSQGETSRLGLADRWWWWWASRQAEWRKLDLVELGAVDYGVGVDGVRVGRLASGWDTLAQDLFASLVIAQEKLSVRVVNTTSEPGLASSAARRIESSGMKVVELATQADNLDQCLVSAPTSLWRTVGVRLLVSDFGCRLQAGSELTLWLGRQYQDLVTGNKR